MAKFVELTLKDGKKAYVNPEFVANFESGGDNITDVFAGEYILNVVGTVDEVAAKLRGEAEKAEPAADDIVGWWIGPMGDIYYVIGRDRWGRYVYQANGTHHLHTETMSYLDNWTRDTDRKGWDR